MRPTSIAEMGSMYLISTALSANNRKVQRAYPAGASEQAKAVILAFASGLMVGGLPERGLS